MISSRGVRENFASIKQEVGEMTIVMIRKSVRAFEVTNMRVNTLKSNKDVGKINLKKSRSTTKRNQEVKQKKLRQTNQTCLCH